MFSNTWGRNVGCYRVVAALHSIIDRLHCLWQCAVHTVSIVEVLYIRKELQRGQVYTVHAPTPSPTDCIVARAMGHQDKAYKCAHMLRVRSQGHK